MPDGIDLGIAFNRPPQDALRYFESKGYRTKHWNWWDTWQDANASAFVIARTARMDVQQSIRDRLRQTLAQGMTEREFVKQLTPQLQRLGWWGKKVIVDSGGSAEAVQEGSPWRLKTIYRTNVHTAYNAGRWKQQVENADSRPYWMYIAVMDAKTRASHAAMHGRVFRYDDPIWNTHYPPCAFNCRCRVRALTLQQVQRMGLSVESSAGRLVEVMQDVGIEKSTGEVIQRPAWQYTAPDGQRMTPSPGWNYNPGRAGFQPDLDRYDYDIARQYVEGSLTGPAFARGVQRMEDAAAELARRLGRVPTRAEQIAAEREWARGEKWAVAILDAPLVALFDARTQVVALSDATMLKQAISRQGQDFSLSDYWKVQRVIEHAQVLVRTGGEESVAFIQSGDEWWQAVVKVTRNREELYLTSFRRTNQASMQAMMRRGEVLRDAR